MRLLIIHNEASYFAGAEKMLGYYLEGLRQTDCDVAVGVVSRSRVLEVIPEPIQRIYIPDKQRFSFGRLARQARILSRCRREFPFDLLHAWTARDWELASLVSWITDKPAVGTLHDHPRANFISKPRRRLMRWCAKWGLRKVVCVSHAVRSKCIVAGYPAERLSTIHNGLPECGPPPSRERNGLNRIGFLGTFSERKGFRGLFAVLDHLDRLGTPGWEMLVAGGAQDAEGEGLAAEMSSQDSQRGWWPRIRWLGWVSRPIDFLRSVDVLLVPSAEFDPFPTVLLEAGLSGVPVVAARVGGVEEIVQDGGTGLLFEPGAWEKAAQQIGLLLLQPAFGESLGRSAAARISEEFTVVKMVAKHLELYSTLKLR